MTEAKPQLSETDLQHFTGDLVRYRHSLNRKVIYTPGIQYVAEVGEAYWLIDAIGVPPFFVPRVMRVRVR